MWGDRLNRLEDKALGKGFDPANPLFRDVGANRLEARIRSHPDVAKAYYSDVIWSQAHAKRLGRFLTRGPAITLGDGNDPRDIEDG
ncbi:hypothetical protein [Novosphingobium flavum]|uniref:hypothetical protein n=1 Tax=Novosphingobium flavum TaxID=1778672 RepID=UPI001C8B4C7A|nr:hypothetical protein [Novosphingobium flavum]